MGLELYARIEEYLDFEEEVRRLHKEFLAILLKKSPTVFWILDADKGLF